MLNLMRFTFVLVCMVLTSVAAAQTTDPSPTPTETERRLQEEINRLKLEKEKAELEKSIRDAKFQPKAEPLSGDVTGAKDLKMEINLQTYKALRRVTDRIACDIKTNVKTSDPKVLLLYKPEVYQALVNYRSMRASLNLQLDSAKSDYDKLLIPLSGGSFDGAIPDITFALRSIVDLLALFRTNVDFTYGSVTVNENALKSMISNSLRKQDPCKASDKSFSKVYINNDITIYDPDVFYPTGKGDSKLITNIGEILSRKQRASIYVLRFDIQTAKSESLKKIIETEESSLTALKTKTQAKIEERISLENQRKKTKSPAKRKELTEKINLATEELTKFEEKRQESANKKQKAETELKTVNRELAKLDKYIIAQLRQLNTDFSQFYTTLTTRDTGGQTPLSQLVKIETLADILDSKPNECYWLAIRSVDAGGTTRVRKNLFRSFYYPDISINGGSIVEYTVSRPNGDIIISNVNNAVQEFRKPGNIFRESEKDNN